MEEYKTAMRTLASEQDIKKLFFYNILVRDDWAAIHYLFITKYATTNKKDFGDRMEFLKFKEEGNNYKIGENWIK